VAHVGLLWMLAADIQPTLDVSIMSRLIMWNLISLDGFFEGPRAGSLTGTRPSGDRNLRLSQSNN
jgi:hypothetical protein